MHKGVSSIAADEDDHYGITWLVHLRNRHSDSVEFVSVLLSKIRNASVTPQDLQDIVGGMRGAAVRYLAENGTSEPGSKCTFCNKSSSDVAVILVSVTAGS